MLPKCKNTIRIFSKHLTLKKNQQTNKSSVRFKQTAEIAIPTVISSVCDIQNKLHSIAVKCLKVDFYSFVHKTKKNILNDGNEA